MGLFMLDHEAIEGTVETVQGDNTPDAALNDADILLDKYYEVAEQLALDRAELLSRLDVISRTGVDKLRRLEEQIKERTLSAERTTRGTQSGIMCVYTPPGQSTSVDVKGLIGYARAHPEAWAFVTYKHKSASASIRMDRAVAPFKDLLP